MQLSRFVFPDNSKKQQQQNNKCNLGYKFNIQLKPKIFWNQLLYIHRTQCKKKNTHDIEDVIEC